MRTAQTVHNAANYLELEALDPLPCGCVAATYRVGRHEIRVLSVEAKGPYCVHLQHSTGRMVESEDPDGSYE